MVHALLGRRDAGVLQQRNGAPPGLCRIHWQVRLDGFGELPTHGVQRVQRGQRVLENRADAPTPDVAHVRVAEVVDALAFQQDLARGHAPRRFQQADDGGARERLARARLAHHAQDFAGGDGKRNVIQGTQRAAPTREFDNEVFDF